MACRHRTSVFDVDQEDLMLPGDVPGRINQQRTAAGVRPA